MKNEELLMLLGKNEISKVLIEMHETLLFYFRAPIIETPNIK